MESQGRGQGHALPNLDTSLLPIQWRADARDLASMVRIPLCRPWFRPAIQTPEPGAAAHLADPGAEQVGTTGARDGQEETGPPPLRPQLSPPAILLFLPLAMTRLQPFLRPQHLCLLVQPHPGTPESQPPCWSPHVCHCPGHCGILQCKDTKYFISAALTTHL